MMSISKRKHQIFDLSIVISILAAIVITYLSLTHGIYDVFPYFYLIPIVIIAYVRPKWSIYGTVLVGWLYLALVFVIGLPESKLYILATLWFYIFVSMGILLTTYSQVYRLEGEKTCGSYYNSQAGAFSFDKKNLKITDNNRKFAEMLHYENEKLRCLSLPDIIPSVPERESFLTQIRDLRRVGNIEVGFLSAEGNIRWSVVSAVETGSPLVICTVVDITDQKLAQDSLTLANKKLNLLNNVTRHDILNQLTALHGYIQLSREASSDSQILSFIAKEEQAAEAIKSQILFTRDYQNIGVHTPEWQNAAEMISLALATIDLHLVSVSVDLAPFEIYADPLLEKVFYNLIENTIRHSEGATTIIITSDTNPDGLDLIIEDNGKGVPEEAKEKIFRREYFRNTGFGLFLSREILAITGLTIHENGIPGKGARFVIHARKGNFRSARS
jgi:PAS domain S-box-containing protein